MRFSPDKRPRRPQLPVPKDLLDVAGPERDEYTFDPEVDIPESVWNEMRSEVEGNVYSGSEIRTRTVRMIANAHLVAPERVKVWRDLLEDSFPHDMIADIGGVSPNYHIQLECLAKYSWLFPDQKGDMLDLAPSVLSQMRALLLRKEKIDLKDRQQALQHLKQLLSGWRENNHLRQICSTLIFLTNFFPDGNKAARRVLAEGKVTPEDLVGEFPKWTNKNFRYGILEALAICFPETRNLIHQDKRIMSELAQVVRSGVKAAGAVGNYTEALTAYDALTAVKVEFNHTGISIQRGPKKKVVVQKPLPVRTYL